jgi:hypothetical protein
VVQKLKFKFEFEFELDETMLTCGTIDRGTAANYDVPFADEAGALAGAPVCLHFCHGTLCI